VAVRNGSHEAGGEIAERMGILPRVREVWTPSRTEPKRDSAPPTPSDLPKRHPRQRVPTRARRWTMYLRYDSGVLKSRWVIHTSVRLTWGGGLSG
jgi:hypothetical protein